jgi:hypothetical protein
MSLFLELNLPHTITATCVQIHGVENAHSELERALEKLVEKKIALVKKELIEVLEKRDRAIEILRQPT